MPDIPRVYVSNVEGDVYCHLESLSQWRAIVRVVFDVLPDISERCKLEAERVDALVHFFETEIETETLQDLRVFSE